MQQIRWRLSAKRMNCTSSHSGSGSEAIPAIEWKQPLGHNTGINLYNCVARTTVPLIVRNPNCVTWYTCGPTVYDSAHLGHAVCYMKLDIIQQILRNHFQLNVVTAMNVTDIDDKVIRRSQELKMPWNELAKKYETEFWADLKRLGIRRADIVLRVGDSMDEIIEFVQKLIDKQAAYVGGDGSVYFRNVNVQGKLQNVNTDVQSGIQLNAVRKSTTDFALWKAAKPGEPFWDVPWKCSDVSTAGRPGWHTECSAMASKIFGATIDVHAGGIDLRFPHHENEESQCVSYHNRPQWVNYWLHIGHLVTTDNVKMSKSLKNTITIDELLSHYTRDQFRMACLLTRYREHIEFSETTMVEAAGALKRFASFLDNTATYSNYKKLQRPIVQSEQLQAKLDRVNVELDVALKDAFNTPHCIQLLNDLISTFNVVMVPNSAAKADSNDSIDAPEILSGVQTIQSAHNFVRRFLHTCGFIDTIAPFESANVITDVSNASDKVDVDKMINELIALRSELRATAKANKDTQLFEICTRLRILLNDNGIEVKDLGALTTWSHSEALRTKKKNK